MSDDDIFEATLLKLIEDKKDKALFLIEKALSDWPERRLQNDHSPMCEYFMDLIRTARTQLYSVEDYGKKRQGSSGGENG